MNVQVIVDEDTCIGSGECAPSIPAPSSWMQMALRVSSCRRSTRSAPGASAAPVRSERSRSPRSSRRRRPPPHRRVAAKGCTEIDGHAEASESVNSPNIPRNLPKCRSALQNRDTASPVDVAAGRPALVARGPCRAGHSRRQGVFAFGARSGRYARKTAPVVVAVSRCTLPWWAWIVLATIARPSPDPPASRERDASAR